MMSWSSRGVIAYLQGRDIWILPPDGEPSPFFTSDATERYATFSPDGAWLAYASNLNGRNEVYVRPFPGPGSATVISGNGGLAPAWSRDGSKLYFRQFNPNGGGQSMMVVDVAPGEPFRAGVAVPLMPWPYGNWTPSRGYDVLPDGSFLATSETDAEADPVENTQLHIVLNWFTELRERVPD